MTFLPVALLLFCQSTLLPAFMLDVSNKSNVFQTIPSIKRCKDNLFQSQDCQVQGGLERSNILGCPKILLGHPTNESWDIPDDQLGTSHQWIRFWDVPRINLGHLINSGMSQMINLGHPNLGWGTWDIPGYSPWDFPKGPWDVSGFMDLLRWINLEGELHLIRNSSAEVKEASQATTQGQKAKQR
ncbi:hypothetical protein K435DRAFT_810838 [Dendrothele bispora CBS 962.96]|uniref:Uncharacterized protein n=1 Tax=Dendrothele bispora (strain CBS 962.96) TaxID=1314807 RepID=A0A4S8KTV3_DENBC|nr:hypothetical protein K435DRAFT_810838 [Dendrothele bispora CBS 962.96]